MKKDLRERLGKEWLFCDGGTGTFLQERGLQGGELPETWNTDHPDIIQELYESYLKAGSNIFNTNTFGLNSFKFPGRVEELMTAAVEIAKKARINTGREDAYIAVDIGPTGKLLEPMGDLSFDKAVEVFGEVMAAGEKAGGDLILIETMSDSYEAKAAVLAAKERTSLPVIVTTVYDQKGKMLTGGNVDSTVAMLEGLGVDALGLNCSLGPDLMIPMVKRMTEVASVPIVVNPNAGLPRTEGGKTVFDVGPEEFSTIMSKIADMGVQVLGGCCGTTPEHIRQTVEKVKAKEFRPNTAKDLTVVTSFCQAVTCDRKPIIIGERINPTGKKRFQQALRDADIDYILSQGLEQEDAGADILDVNVGLPEIDEPKMMREVVTKLQGVTGLPLQLDTTDPEALEQGLRYYNGKAMINSVNGKREVIEMVMPLVKKYGGVLVGLALDEDGIPATADGRIAVAEKIYRAADEYGIPRKDIVIDGLCMTISSDSSSAVTTLETLRRIRDDYHGHTILGVSNISFGLPQRQVINSYFLTMAMQMGLSFAIMNPNNQQMMVSYRSFLALSDMDPQCMGFIEAYANASLSTVSTGGASGQAGAGGGSGQGTADGAGKGSSLGNAIERGMAGVAETAMKEAMKTADPLEIINSELIPALDKVGKGFEKGTVFLPQLLQSADAAKAAFEIVKASMAGKPRELKGKIIIATVKGDIHDIGKNIVKVMLENYGYDVIDLGKDVPPEAIVDRAVQDDVKLIGLSALMTTTVVSMEDTIKLLREKKPDTKVVVGGAVMTQEYADAIGADCYAKDAMATVRYADEVFSK
ncbi:5-methyltetrahydrofolate--homocysteine methyltransferase [Lachnospiraceae bacterium NE2001]|nr:5-methyltetrahydrofolate--homocysteine methyltransferase [Lachnospiraceae bacterium NE2001]